ncbi:MAG: DMT family transporter, partial [Candidatus Babeliales bacterium]
IFFHIYLAYATEFWALQYVSGAKTALIYNLSPFVTALLAYLVFADRLTWKKWLGLIIGFVGFIPLLKSNGTMNLVGFISVPEIMLLISVVAACIGWIIMKKLLQRGYSPLLVNGIAMIVGGILSFITSYFIESWNPAVSAWWPVLWQGGLLILLANLIYYNFYGYLLHRYSITFLSFVGFVTPIFTALFDWLFFGLTVSPAFYGTTVCVACGLWLFWIDERLTAKKLK